MISGVSGKSVCCRVYLKKAAVPIKTQIKLSGSRICAVFLPQKDFCLFSK